MKLTTVLSVLFLALMMIPTAPASAKVDGKNLVDNADFSQIDQSGDPVGWYRGGYGNNERSYSLFTCPYVYTEQDLLATVTQSNFIFRPFCPPYASRILGVSTSNYVDGNGNWYFRDIEIPANRKLYISFDYQPYTYNAYATIRYTLKNGSFKYEHFANLPQVIMGGMGYVGWSNIQKEIKAPKDAVAMTVLFSVQSDGVCGPICGPSYGRLSIANVSVTSQKPNPNSPQPLFWGMH
jgi:hypothetical protein